MQLSARTNSEMTSLMQECERPRVRRVSEAEWVKAMRSRQRRRFMAKILMLKWANGWRVYNR